MTDQLAVTLYIAIRDGKVNERTLPILYDECYIPLLLSKDRLTEYSNYVRRYFRGYLRTMSNPDDCGYIIVEDIDGYHLITASPEIALSRDTISFWKVRNVNDAYRSIPQDVTDIFDVIKGYIID